MTGVMLRCRPPLLSGALTLPNIRILEEILRMVLLFAASSLRHLRYGQLPTVYHVINKILL